jgi:hypothetical protein
MIAPYIEAGMTHVLVANYGETITTGDFGDIVANVTLLQRTFDAIRNRVPA